MAISAMARALTATERWLGLLNETLDKVKGPHSERYYLEIETADRSRIRDSQEEKLRAMVPYLYENSPFYRAKLRAAKLVPADIKSVDDLVKVPITTKQEMAQDLAQHPPWGTYSPLSEQAWRERGWFVFTTSGSTAVPRPFRMTHLDRELWAPLAARAAYAQGLRSTDTALTCTNYNPHVYFWGVHRGMELLGMKIIPGGVPTERRIALIDLYKPTVICATPSYVLHLAEVMRRQGIDPAASSVKKLLLAGEPASGIPSTRRRIEQTWQAEFHDYYGCTEAAQAAWAHTCVEGLKVRPVSEHLEEDLAIWETVDPDTLEPVPEGQRGLTVITALNSEGSPQLRFLLGDFTVIDYSSCVCGRTLARARGGCVGRADDMLNVRGLTLFPSALEEIIRGFDELGDEFQIVVESRGVMDALILVVEPRQEMAGPQADKLRQSLATEVVRKCELRPEVQIVAPNTLPKTELKAHRVVDRRQTL